MLNAFYHDLKLILGGKPSLLGMYGYGRKWLGGGLFLSNGSKWLRNRKLIENAFRVEALKHYVKVFNEATEIFLVLTFLFNKNIIEKIKLKLIL